MAGAAPMSQADLITVGRVNLDLYAQQVGVPFTQVRGFDAMVGGSPTNVAIAAQRLGLHSVAFTAVGCDVPGDWVLRSLLVEGVDARHVHRKPGHSTSLALLAVLPPDEYPLMFYREDPADVYLTIRDAERLPLEGTRALLVSGNALSRGTTAEAAAWLCRVARHQRLTLFIDLDYRAVDWEDSRHYAQQVRPCLDLADVLIGTLDEWRLLLGLQVDQDANDVASSVSTLVAGQTRCALLKRGSDGVTVVASDDIFYVPALPVAVANTMGAGDAFAAGLIAARLSGDDWHQAAAFASACAAVQVSRSGCSSGFPRLVEVVDLLAASNCAYGGNLQ